MRRTFLFVLGICLALDGTCYAAGNSTVPGEIGRFVALQGPQGPGGAAGTDACPPRIYDGTKTNGCWYVYSQQRAKNGSGTCVDTSDAATPLQQICDGCTPMYTRKFINKVGNNITYDNDSRGATTIGTRMTVSGCGSSTTMDAYDGDDGTSFNYKGSVANCAALNNVSNPAQNDAYIVNGDGEGKLCIYNGSSWPTCPDGCAEFTGPQGEPGDGVCTGHESDSTAVKNTTTTYSGPSGSNGTYYTTRGYMTTVHTPCMSGANIPNTTQDDPCVIIAAPAGSGCTGASMTYYECKRQGQQGVNAAGTTYNLCLTTTGSSIASVIDNPCYGVASGNLSTTERTQTTEYTAPTKTGTNSYYDTPGKMVTTSVKCNSAGNTVIGTTQDKCEEIAKPNGVCTDSSKVYYKCTRQDNNSTQYNLCAAGSSVLSAAQSAAAAVDPCGGSTSSTRIKSTSTTAYNRGTMTSGVYSSVGKSAITKTACDGTTTYTVYEQDNCVEVAKPSNTCTAATSAYLRCTTGSATTDTTYYVCQDLGSGNNSLAGKIDGKMDVGASIADSQLSNKVLTTDNIGEELTQQMGQEGALRNVVQKDSSGKISASDLPATVIRSDNMGEACTVSGGGQAGRLTVDCGNNTIAAALVNALAPVIAGATGRSTNDIQVQ